MPAAFTHISAGGQSVPLFLLQADKRGTVTSPVARDELLASVADGTYRDVYVFAHGWNNDFDESRALFTKYFEGFLTRRPAAADWKPVFVGVQWPSIVLVFPWDKGPQIAGSETAAADHRFQQQAVASFQSALGAGDATQFAALTAKPTLSAPEQAELVRLARSALSGDLKESELDTIPSEAELLETWRALEKANGADSASAGEFGFAAEPGAAGPQAAGLFGFLDPRNLLRGATVYMMKDRAGTIGSEAVKPLLERLTQLGASVRLIGHSYGARVMLAALTTATLAAKVRSALLLQPAVNQYCFAEAGQIPDTAGAGGFRRALDQVALPIYTTFSARDFPLHGTFHLALRRSKDLGEAEIAGGAPSIYCALGGYGPQGLSGGATAAIEIADNGAFAYPATCRVVALDGTNDRIRAHGDVTNGFTCWALVEQDSRAA